MRRAYFIKTLSVKLNKSWVYVVCTTLKKEEARRGDVCLWSWQFWPSVPWLAYVAWQLQTEVVEITMACWCQLRFRTMLALRILHNNLSTLRHTGGRATFPSQHNFAKASSFHMYVVDAATSSGILKAKQKLGRTFNSDKLAGIAFTKISKLTMCSA